MQHRFLMLVNFDKNLSPVLNPSATECGIEVGVPSFREQPAAKTKYGVFSHGVVNPSSWNHFSGCMVPFLVQGWSEFTIVSPWKLDLIF